MMARRVTGGVDTHRDTHVAAAVDELGRVLGTRGFATTKRGYAALLEWLETFGRLDRVGIEGTGVYGNGLQRFLHEHGVATVEIDRPDRKARRWQGKDDTVDAIAAARATVAGLRATTPKARSGAVEALRNIRVARRSAIEQRADAQRRIRTLVVTAPDELRSELRSLPLTKLIARCAAMRPDANDIESPMVGARIALRALARRFQALTHELSELDAHIERLARAINPQLLRLTGVGPEVAAQLLQTAGDNADRVRSEAAFAMLCGTAPIPASSGLTQRHRLNRSGDRQANRALHTIVLTRMRHDQRTRDYVARRTAEGLGKMEIMRCLKRYVAREVYAVLSTTT